MELFYLPYSHIISLQKLIIDCLFNYFSLRFGWLLTLLHYRHHFTQVGSCFICNYTTCIIFIFVCILTWTYAAIRKRCVKYFKVQTYIKWIFQHFWTWYHMFEIHLIHIQIPRAKRCSRIMFHSSCGFAIPIEIPTFTRTWLWRI